MGLGVKRMEEQKEERRKKDSAGAVDKRGQRQGQTPTHTLVTLASSL